MVVARALAAVLDGCPICPGRFSRSHVLRTRHHGHEMKQARLRGTLCPIPPVHTRRPLGGTFGFRQWNCVRGHYGCIRGRCDLKENGEIVLFSVPQTRNRPEEGLSISRYLSVEEDKEVLAVRSRKVDASRPTLHYFSFLSSRWGFFFFGGGLFERDNEAVGRSASTFGLTTARSFLPSSTESIVKCEALVGRCESAGLKTVTIPIRPLSSSGTRMHIVSRTHSIAESPERPSRGSRVCTGGMGLSVPHAIGFSFRTMGRVRNSVIRENRPGKMVQPSRMRRQLPGKRQFWELSPYRYSGHWTFGSAHKVLEESRGASFMSAIRTFIPIGTAHTVSKQVAISTW